MGLDDDARDYHRRDPPGKLEVSTTKPTNTQRDLSLAYSPGVAAPCRDIDADAGRGYEYTAKGNIVGVVSDGSAVLGLGDIGPLASKPVMEGKGVLFKRFADIDVFDLELDTESLDSFVDRVAAMEPTFGGVNLEDIAAPACFEAEERLRERMNVPVFHDDQHGTAIITGAALLNAVDVVDKDLADLEIVFSGAGAAATATATFYTSLGVPTDQITMCDIDGVVTDERAAAGDPHEHVSQFAADADAVGGTDLADAMAGADVFVGLSAGGIVSREMVRSMADDPIVFAMANPDPEIAYDDAKAAREDTVIVATGRSDYPNQVNNVLCFLFVFRGALDARAREITEGMKVAAAEALADLTREDVPDSVRRAYGDQPLEFGPEYVIPKPLDERVLFGVAPAVAAAAVDDGVARRDLDPASYVEELEDRLGGSREAMRAVLTEAKRDPKRLVLAEGTDETVVRAAYQIADRGIADPVLVGARAEVEAALSTLGFDFAPEVVDPDEIDLEPYADLVYERRRRKGVTRREARDLVREHDALASALVAAGDADAMLTGRTHHYPSALRRPLQIIGTAEDATYAAGVYLLAFDDRVVFCADATVNQDPDADVLAEVTRHTAALARRFNVEPRAALLSYSDFGSVDTAGTAKPRTAARRLREDAAVGFPVDGEMQADTAVVDDFLGGDYEFAALDDPANVLVFPNLEAGNIAYKLLHCLGGADVVGPMLVGMDAPIHVLQRGDDVADIVNLAGVAVATADD
ncbi:NADP-dependent malic enzyme [Halobaculum gomorrense]|uniref:Malate dehydrogenase (Oxaloacetate-decarboxylating)(NADP+) n=1 Tax=Halobaculum gomorrense TaxID=43928 RepID=A0A1M5NWD3_9EURY|nr:NADP-dependent malic enzyme [Halobaculum gomorrense]SHG93479.1 malate dehydrogenase (oxaloacetate-decarboxylating)(NADP+) [Halobaculum gomorrense]